MCLGEPLTTHHKSSHNHILGARLAAYALPRSVTNALGQTSYTQYDYYPARPVDGKDANGAHTVLRYDDPLDRLTQGVRAFGSAARSQTTVSYADAAPQT